MLSLVRRFLAGVAFVAFLATGVLTTAKPASASNNNTWVYVGVVVVLCFVIPGTPCHPAGKTANAKSRDVANTCDGTSETAKSLAYTPAEGLGALHTYALHAADPATTGKSLTESDGTPACASSGAATQQAPPGT